MLWEFLIETFLNPVVWGIALVVASILTGLEILNNKNNRDNNEE